MCIYTRTKNPSVWSDSIQKFGYTCLNPKSRVGSGLYLWSGRVFAFLSM
ncbi:hypothetical protein PanWU01x14_122280 [Parasponia andersonii]|uniref:Uncharacterized protein n=1 Tax=Parasponia andersonii TaxID=3476 RepID=A0A2P5CUL7_PARAD|nr:hypothetical protein PanWU01x14_122280 [Parasponia andersonii]